MALLMGIDLGSSSLKTILVDETGVVKALSHRDYMFDSPRGGFAEQDPEVWWNACCETVREAIAKSGLKASQITGLSFSGQMHGLVMLDSSYRVVRPAILHFDARSSEQVAQINTVFGADGIRRLMMNPVYTGFLLPSLLWVRENEPENYEKIRYVCLPKDYIRFRMTGELLSDYSDASATLAYDIENHRWSREILDRLALPSQLFPECRETTNNAGAVFKTAADLTGLVPGTAVAAGGGDQVMQGIGNGIADTGAATVNIGSSGQVCFQIDRPVVNSALSTNMFCGYKKSRWILLGATMTAGMSLKWWNGVSGGSKYGDMDAEAAALQPGSGGVVFLPYLNGERTPHLNPNLSGVFMGVNIGTTRAHMTRAVMEGVAYSLMQCLEVCGGLGFSAESLVASGGGARSRLWLQMQADIYNLPLRVAATEEQACLGAAIAAGVATGLYGDLKQGCRAVVRYQEGLVTPNAKNHKIYQEYYALYKQVYTTNKDLLNKITVTGRR